MLAVGYPAIQQRLYPLRVAARELLRRLLDVRQQIGITHQIGNPELHQAGLPGPQYLAGAAQGQVLFGDDETVGAFAHDAQSLAPKGR